MNYLAQKLINYCHDHSARLLFRHGLWVGITFIFWAYTITLMAR